MNTEEALALAGGILESSVWPMETTHPKALQSTLEMINAETQLLFASDWPHFDFDLPQEICDLPYLSEQAKRNILGLNAARIFGLDPTPRKKL